MHIKTLKAICIILLLGLFNQQVFAQSKKELKAQLASTQDSLKVLQDSLSRETTDFNIAMHQISYALAMNIAMNIKQQGFLDSLHVPSFQQAFLDVRHDQAKMEPMEAGALIKTFINEVNSKRTAALRADGEEFLAENKKKESVVTLESGLQYEVITEGTGEKPTADARVKVHYEGSLTDGTVFDSSYERGEPIVLSVQGVIAGWTEALQLMPTGSKWKLFIPYNLAYGERGAGSDIPPYATLIFDVELLEIVE
ncbi:MAG: peptidylprolyl isomerase [Thalassobius sp.]|nr:peptidylprolyl isomerase [Thalassovita sp.]